MSIWNSFDAGQIEPDTGYDPIPDGEYKAMVKAVVEKPTRAGGAGLSVRLDILGPTHAGRCVFQWVNIQHPKREVVDIGKRELSALCRAVGVLRPRGPGDLVGRVCTIIVGAKLDDRGEMKNVVKRYIFPDEAAPHKPAQAAPEYKRAEVHRSQEIDDDEPAF